MGSDSSWIRELELMFLSRIDGIGLVVDPGTWQELYPGLELDRNLTLDWNWTGESDRWDRTRRGSGNWKYVSESDRWDRTRHGSGNLTAWLEPGPRQLGWNRDLDSLAGTGTFSGSSLDFYWNRIFSAWLEPEQ